SKISFLKIRPACLASFAALLAEQWLEGTTLVLSLLTPSRKWAVARGALIGSGKLPYSAAIDNLSINAMISSLRSPDDTLGRHNHLRPHRNQRSLCGCRVRLGGGAKRPD